MEWDITGNVSLLIYPQLKVPQGSTGCFVREPLKINLYIYKII